jgi:hypothetical protein
MAPVHGFVQPTTLEVVNTNELPAVCTSKTAGFKANSETAFCLQISQRSTHQLAPRLPLAADRRRRVRRTAHCPTGTPGVKPTDGATAASLPPAMQHFSAADGPVSSIVSQDRLRPASTRAAVSAPSTRLPVLVQSSHDAQPTLPSRGCPSRTKAATRSAPPTGPNWCEAAKPDQAAQAACWLDRNPTPSKQRRLPLAHR